MLEVVNAPSFIRQGEAKVLGSTVYQGHVGYIAGVDSTGTTIIRMPLGSAEAAKSFYPIKKYKMEEDLSDTSDAVDKIPSGSRIVYFEGGEFWTDRIARAGIGFGRALPLATAYGARGIYNETVVHTVLPTTPLYVGYTAANPGRLQVTKVATTQVMGAANGVGVFRLIEAYGSTAASIDRGTVIKARFKAIMGYTGIKY